MKHVFHKIRSLLKNKDRRVTNDRRKPWVPGKYGTLCKHMDFSEPSKFYVFCHYFKRRVELDRECGITNCHAYYWKFERRGEERRTKNE